MNKQSLRKHFLAERRKLPVDELNGRNEKICDYFRDFIATHDYLNTIHCFLPIRKNKEVNTWPLIDVLTEKNKRIIVSKSELNTNRMQHYLLGDRNSLVENRWGIPEPTGGKEVSDKEIDAVLIPLIVFDKSGHRIGYGKGYYDRFLSDCRLDVVKIGLSLLPPVHHIKEKETHDVAMDYCITSEKIYSF